MSRTFTTDGVQWTPYGYAHFFEGDFILLLEFPLLEEKKESPNHVCPLWVHQHSSSIVPNGMWAFWGLSMYVERVGCLEWEVWEYEGFYLVNSRILCSGEKETFAPLNSGNSLFEGTAWTKSKAYGLCGIMRKDLLGRHQSVFTIQFFSLQWGLTCPFLPCPL